MSKKVYECHCDIGLGLEHWFIKVTDGNRTEFFQNAKSGGQQIVSGSYGESYSCNFKYEVFF